MTIKNGKNLHRLRNSLINTVFVNNMLAGVFTSSGFFVNF